MFNRVGLTFDNGLPGCVDTIQFHDDITGNDLEYERTQPLSPFDEVYLDERPPNMGRKTCRIVVVHRSNRDHRLSAMARLTFFLIVHPLNTEAIVEQFMTVPSRREKETNGSRL